MPTFYLFLQVFSPKSPPIYSHAYFRKAPILLSVIGSPKHSMRMARCLRGMWRPHRRLTRSWMSCVFMMLPSFIFFLVCSREMLPLWSCSFYGLVSGRIPRPFVDRASLRGNDGFHMSVWEPFSTYHAGDGLKQRIGFIMQCHCSKSLRV